MQKMQRHNIINNTLRLALVAIALLAACFSLHAATNVPKSTKPKGSGNTASPYLVTNVNEFLYIYSEPGKIYRQDADLDFSGITFDNRVINSNFAGTYDGNGFTISNITIDWSAKPTVVTSKTHFVNGIFLSVSGKIRNLVLDNVQLLYGENDNAYTKDTEDEVALEIGVLCGNVYNGAAIENIIIKNSKIEAQGDPNATNYFVGGLVGDVRSAAGGTDAITAIIKNIYAQVDIDLHNATRHKASVNDDAARPHQFQIGGIVGRLRKATKDYVPMNTMYEGTINAPIAMIGPCYGGMRYDRKSIYGGYFTTVYAGQVKDPGDPAKVSNINAGSVLDNQSDDNNRYFGDYKIYHYSESATSENKIIEEAVTNSYPIGTGCYYGTRTFSPNYAYSDKETIVDYNSAADMASFQGVNHGTYLETDTRISTLEEMFNTYAASDENLNAWQYHQDWGFYYTAFSVTHPKYDTFVPVISCALKPEQRENYKIKWILSRNETDTDDVIIRPIASGALCISTDTDLMSNDILRYKKVKVELVNLADPNFKSESYEFEFPDIAANISRISPVTFKANIYDQRKESEYKLRWYKIEGGEKIFLRDIEGPIRESQYSFADETQLADAIGFEIYDINGNIYYYQNGTRAIVELPISNIDSETVKNYKVKISRKIIGKDTYYVARVYDGDGTMIAGGHPDDADYIANPLISYLWESTREVGDSHSYIPMSTNKSYTKGYATETYYKATGYYSGWPMSYAVLGDKDVIFVYDIAKHNERATILQNTSVLAKKDMPLSDFDGKEHEADYPDGDDANDGRDPYHAVKTLQHAYELLNPDNGPEDNIIVVMGFNYEPHFLDLEAAYDNIYNKAATITGSRGNISGGAIVLSNNGTSPIGLRGATVFENLNLVGVSDSKYAAYTGAGLYLYCNLQDLTFGENIVMRGYNKLGAGTGTIDGTVAPDITIVGGAFNHNIAGGDLTSYIDAKRGNKDAKFTTITIKSGCYGRIIGAARNTKKNTTSKNLFGNPTTPHRVRINIDLQHKDETAGLKEYWPDGSPSYDIGLLTGGQTDGTVYSEAEIEMNNGQIGRYISGNISYGRKADGGPSDSFFGSTIFTFRGGFIQELYGGSLGRAKDTESQVDVKTVQAYFYGRSIINIEGGTVNTDLNGAGAGGVAGVGTDIYHTDDRYIPYYDDNEVLKYGTYEDAKGKVVKMKMSDGTTILDFAKTYNEINVRYGTVNGNIFGAGGGYSSQTSVSKASNLAGNLYGDCVIRISEDEPLQQTLIKGNVYGAGAGSDNYNKDEDNNDPENFKALAQLYGNCKIEISGGTIDGNVYAGAMGIEGFPDMAATYGKTQLDMTGGTVLGDIYGGSALAAVRPFELSEAEATALGEEKYFTKTITIDTNSTTYYYLKDSGNTYLNISGGVIGNCIYGGSQGNNNHKASIDGDTHITITGGDFIDTPYIDFLEDENGIKHAENDSVAGANGWNVLANPDKYRTFNIYGGGNVNCDISGTAYVRVTSSLLNSEFSFVPKEQNPNALTSHEKSERFQSAYMDITYRRFCVYGGGYGEKTNVLNTDVYVSIPPERMGVTLPHGNTLTSYLPHQSFFDIAGGGYSGDVGYWATSEGQRSREISKANMSAAQVAALYDHYVGGRCKVTIDGYTYARKIIGGGFYGSCRSTNTHVLCGSLRQVYGGSLLGYVHDKALLQFGNRTEDFIRKVGVAYVYDAAGRFGDHEGEYVEYEGDKDNVTDDVWAQAEARAKQLNDYIFITEDIYGGNDVKGIIGTQLYRDELTGDYAIDATDGGPLFQTDVTKTEEKGIVFNIYGGTFMDNVYSAGNGHYRGYYVPEWVRYNDGPARIYRMVKSSTDNTKTARAYRSRPMVGSVNVNLRGNSKDDYVKLHKDFFGGGSECTIGQFNTILPLEDPRRMVQGGHLHVNFGGYVQIDGNVYMGAEGKTMGQQLTVPEGIDIATFNGSTTAALAELGDIAYGHWYHNGSNYVPGFPAAGEVDANFNMTGQHMFDSYMQNVQMQGDIETTFYRNLYERDATTGKFVYWKDPQDPTKDLIDATGQRIRLRKHWAPGELATKTDWDDNDPDSKYAYNAEGITMNSFYLGGLSGTMTNNNLMVYDYEYHRDVAEGTSTGTDLEKWGSIYRVTLPAGVTIRDKVVMGSENATVEYYPYSADGKSIVKDGDNDGQQDAPAYTYEGGLVTQSTYSFDLIVYNDAILNGTDIRHYLPAKTDTYAGFYNDPEMAVGGSLIKDLTSYTLQNGTAKGTTIYRKTYNQADVPTLNSAVNADPNRFGLATTDADFKTAYVGPREKRRENKGTGIGNNAKTVTKLTVACQFDPLADEQSTGDDDHEHHYGGNIYGGCYRSGIVVGNVVMNLGSNLLGKHVDESDAASFGEISSLRYNIGRVFGGGFGEKTRIEGDTYVNLLKNFRGMNVFGGGMKGDVTGTAHVIYIGAEDKSYVFGHIYGGGLMGSVGTPQYLDEEKTQVNPEATQQSTVVRLFSGNVDRVYGGSCMGNLYGRTFVELCDAVTSELDHLDISKMTFDWGGSRLIAGKVFGGNDISGTIVPYVYTTDNNATDIETKEFRDYSCGVYVHEIAESSTGTGSGAPAHEAVGPGKTSPGSDNGYNGFPLIGDLYGGGNGDYGTQDGQKYASGTIVIANGEATGSQEVSLASRDLPHATTTHIYLAGGTVINAYGGADMSTVTEDAKVSVNYPTESFNARAGFETKEELERVWRVLHFSSDELMDEVTTQITIEESTGGTTTTKKCPIFAFPIYRLFGGNNNADMNIQPSWTLTGGFVGSLYSGGNFGRMTYYNPDPDTSKGENKGLTLTIDSHDMHIDNVYGGARVGDIMPLVYDETNREYVLPTVDDTFYGVTLNIHKGVIEHVYGGNDVAGYVHFGTNVNISGAISGDVYCAGNGNYLYKYDRTGSLMDYSDAAHTRVQEHYEFETAEYKGARYFLLPAKADYGFVATKDSEGNYKSSYDATDAQTIMAINSYRPNVERTKLYIEGTADNHVWVKGNVYCGGNSSTVVTNESDAVEFKIGSYVTLNGVFLGSNGESLADGQMIQYTEMLNAKGNQPLDMTAANDLQSDQIPTSEASALGLGKYEYPLILDLYMRAVEITEKPKNFDFGEITEAYIGDFVVGGNRGSMLTSKKIELTFPETLTIYNRIIGGCKDANVVYKGVTHLGGLTRAVTPPTPTGSPLPAKASDNTKLQLDIKSKFIAREIEYNESDNTIALVSAKDASTCYPDGICNIYGGCYQSGTTIGDILIDVYSDMLHYDTDSAEDTDHVDKADVVKGMEANIVKRNFTVFGGGYGQSSTVMGDITVRMLPTAATATVKHPSAASVFGGAQEGLVIGDTRVEIRDGKILGNVYGASEAAVMQGNTAVIVGYPTYYTAKEAGVFSIKRSDYFSETARHNKKMANGNFAMVKSVAYDRGEIVSSNVYDMIIGRVNDEVVAGTKEIPVPGTTSEMMKYDIGMEVQSDAIDTYMVFFTNPIDTTSANPKLHIDHYFTKHEECPHDIDPTLKWDDIVIWIGDQGSSMDDTQPYYGQGNVYGGGFIPNVANQSLSGKQTVLRYDNSVYGGNTAVMIWDNKNNATIPTGEQDDHGNDLKDHVSVGTSHYVKVTTTVGADKMGYYEKTNVDGKEIYVYQTSGKMAAGHTYYTKEADGGVYGGGRKVFVDGFSSVDLAYYGYAEHSPENPKLLNTLQRADVVTVTDCCMELIGAPDFTNDTYDATLYAVNRVGELRMVSSLSGDENLVGCTKASEDDHILVYNQPRSRNYIGFYHKVHDLASFYSNWTMERKYHDGNGDVSTKDYNNSDRKYYWKNKAENITDYLTTGQYTPEGEKFNITDWIIDKYASEGIETYTLHKHDIVEDYYDNKANDFAGLTPEAKAEVLNLFNQRNVGTSGNMIGIRSGYSLSFQGHCLADENSSEEVSYSGPVYGVTEMKLLTVAVGEGGGYVYALNHHYDPAVDGKQRWHETGAWMSEWGQDFYMVSGNFVFPGAAYMTPDAIDATKTNSNYIIDDCMPETIGYDGLMTEYNEMATGQHGPYTGYGVNQMDDQHYWYVNGQIYRFNVTLTGITSDEPGRNFWLNDKDDIVALVTLKHGAKVRVSEVTWMDAPTSNYDLVDTNKDYKLYFTIDHNTHNAYAESGNGAYVAEISRVTMSDNTEAGYKIGYAKYNESGTGHDNLPRLGIRLYDNVKNRLADSEHTLQDGHDYYDKYLAGPHEVQVVLEAQNEGETLTYKYIINLTIDYLLGPLVRGEIEIENCALPGEYIYVNTKNVEVDMDATMGVTNQFFKIYPTKEKTEGGVSYRDRILDESQTPPEYISYKVEEDNEEYKNCLIDGNERMIHIPAYYYMDGWEVTFGVTAGGEDFEITLPGYTPKEVEDDANPGQKITVPDYDKPIAGNRLQVHNYHRMKPRQTFNGQPIDLRFVEGARIYIEDDEDMIEYFKYLDRVQSGSGSTLPDDRVIHPQYAENLDFYLQTNVNIPTAAELEYDKGHKLVLKNNFHGNGKIMRIPWNAKITMDNHGKMYNVGFVMAAKPDNISAPGYSPTIYNTNEDGLIENCYYFNEGGVGTLTTNGSLRNCYQNTPVPKDFEGKYNQLLQISDLGFRYGQVAYNLNSFYLQKRHILLHGPTATDAWHTDNNSFDLAAVDKALKEASNYGDYDVKYIEQMFNNGDYRYAFYKLPDDYTQFTEALRTAAEPNYFDYLSYHATGKPVSKHDYSHKVDESRWCDTHKVYHPRFDLDYLFFGQDLTVHVDENNTTLPEMFSPDTRVYRVGGFYGSAADKGYYFNRIAFVDSPIMTAVDFVGYRDRDLYDENGDLKSEYRDKIEDDGWIIETTRQEIYWAPTIDLPWIEEGGEKVHDFERLTIDTDKVTHNLLVYTRDNDKAAGYVARYHYHGDFVNTQPQYHSDANIKLHHIVDNETEGPVIYGDYFHLVDGHAFNAPVAFKVKQGWYTRQPKDYAESYTYEDGAYVKSYKTAWETICLPFDVEMTYAATSDRNTFSQDMCEITHFYGEDYKGHEYWLRRLVGIDDKGEELQFARPTADNQHTDHTDKVGDLVYSNSTLRDLYQNAEYMDEHDGLYHGDDASWSRTIEGYRYLTGGIPYIVTYPGQYYYEFDLSGVFYAKTYGLDLDDHVVPQSITYFAKQKMDGSYATIPVSDNLRGAEFAAGTSGFAMAGTFANVSNDEADRSVLCDVVGDLYVINDDGTEFVKAKAGQGRVAPFHAYVKVKGSSRKPSRGLLIGGDVETLDEEEEEVVAPDEPEQPADELEAGIEYWVQDGALYIRTPEEADLYIYNMAGQAVKHIRAYPGLNRYTGLTPGYYVVGGFKFMIR